MDGLTENQVLDILRQVGCRVSAAGFILTSTKEGDDIRHTLPTLIEDCAEDIQELLERYCAVTPPDSPS